MPKNSKFSRYPMGEFEVFEESELSHGSETEYLRYLFIEKKSNGAKDTQHNKFRTRQQVRLKQTLKITYQNYTVFVAYLLIQQNFFFF
jgi:hypothetical protein